MSGFSDTDVVVMGYSRTPIGSFGGALSKVDATVLGTAAIAGALKRASIAPSDVGEVFMGNVLSAGLGQAPARQSALRAGVPVSVPCTTVNKVCSSGLKAVMLGANQILLGQVDVVVVGGMESMSKTPYYSTQTRFGNKLGSHSLVDGIAFDGLRDAYSQDKMGNCAELCSAVCGIDRAAQDAFAAESYRRAAQATSTGKFSGEITPLVIKSRRGDVVVTEDEECTTRFADLATLSMMRPAGFKPTEGAAATVTAGSASTISDGAAALVLASGKWAREHSKPVVAIITGYADAAQEPEWFTTAPALALPKALARAGIAQNDVDFFEINEAFAVVAVANQRILDIPDKKLNIYGGAVSLGHPLGCSGARILCTLLSALRNEGGKVGAAGICNGGGGASAMVVQIPSAGVSRV